MAGTLNCDPTPASDLLSVSPAWGGSASSGAAALSARPTMAGLITDAPPERMPDGRASAEAAYGSALSDDTPRAPPCVEMELAESSREYRIGYRIRIAGADGRDFSVSIEGTHQETPPEVIRHTSPSRAPCTNNRGTPSLPCYRLRSRHPG